MMNLKYLLLVLSIPIIMSCSQATCEIDIEWKSLSNIDFSFTKQWEYDEYIFHNQFGQLIQDGIIDPRTEIMKDTDGRIKAEYLFEYYQLVDTTHNYYTISCTSNAPQFDQANYIVVEEYAPHKYQASTLLNASTHSSLHFLIESNKCQPSIHLISIDPETELKLSLNNKSYIHIDKDLLKKDTLKAIFDFSFINHNDKNAPLWWKGKILAPISKSF